MTAIRHAVLTIILALSPGTLLCQVPPEDASTPGPPGKDRFLVLPALAYLPETRFIGGVVGAYFWQSRDTLRKSSVSGQLLYSQNDQFQTGVAFEVFSDSGRAKLTGEMIYAYWPGKFYGIGNRTPGLREEPFTERFFRATLGMYISGGAGFSFGPEYEIRVTSPVETSPDGDLATGTIEGVKRYVASGPGVAVILDTRDDNFIPLKGRFIYLAGKWFSPAFGSDYRFGRYTLDAREYVPLYGEHVVALQAYVCAIAGSAPYQMLPLLGGDARGRGYYSGRYRDNLLYTVQAEYRSPLVLRCGLVLFGGITQVAEGFHGAAIRSIHPFSGFGVRFRLLNDTRINLRFDWGFGDNGSGNYVQVNEAF